MELAIAVILEQNVLEAVYDYAGMPSMPRGLSMI